VTARSATPPAWRAWRTAARRREAAIALLWSLPACALAAVLAWRVGGIAWVLPALAGLAGLAAIAARVARIDDAAIARRLDAAHPALEDSAALLHEDAGALDALARLQQARLHARLPALSSLDLRARWPRQAAWTAAALLLLAALAALWPARFTPRLPAPPVSPRAAPPVEIPGLRAASLRVDAPAYTRRAQRTVAGLDATVLAGSALTWTLEPRHAVARLALQFHDGATLPLAREGAQWRATLTARRTRLYRVLADGAPLAPRWHRLVVQADRAPRLRVLQPDRPLTTLVRGQPAWPLSVEADDDFGLGAATLQLTLAQGSGENVRFSTRTLVLAGSGDATRRRYRRRIDLGALGFAPGDDLVLRVLVSDNRTPSPQLARSPAYILRWPAPRGAQASGVEGIVTRTLPAYFRSQRQIIIDTEALLAARRTLDAARFATRSDGIGVDQRILRLRYGQFLGEESEGGGQSAPRIAPAPKPPAATEALAAVIAPSSDAPQSAAPTPASAPADAHDEHDDGAASPPRAGGGSASDGGQAAVVAAFGHTHDEPEAATLLDPDTRALLKSALDAMWLAEGELRTSHPERALPHEYRALRLVKQVQQASRIYLARVGLELPPIDASRRMGGKREGIAPGALPQAAAHTDADAGGVAAAALWPLLDDSAARAPAAAAIAQRDARAEAFAAWLRTRAAQGADDDATLALFEAFSAWRADPACATCRAALRRQLWPWLPAAPLAPSPRTRADAAAQRYLDALNAAPLPDAASTPEARP
jgi:hypothetical protein